MRYSALARYLRACPRALLASLALAASVLPARAAISIVSAGSPSSSTYVLGGAAHGQNFNQLPTSGGFTWNNDFSIPGWSAVSGAGTLANVAVSAIDGTPNPPNLVLSNVGVSGSTERAFA